MPAADRDQQINPDKIAHIEIARGAGSERATVRVFLLGGGEPMQFEFSRMEEAIAFYQDLWSRRSARGDESVSNTA
jgi:hypothetical protein